MPESTALQLEQLRDEFEQAWQEGVNVPCLDDFLKRSPASLRAKLIVELVPIDLEYRWRRFHGKYSNELVADLPACPRVKDYVDRFGDLFPGGEIPTELLTEEQQTREHYREHFPFGQIHSLCETFLLDRQGGSPEGVRVYLNQIASEAQPTLLRNILHLEIERRRSAGEQPQAQEYVEQFPKYASLIRTIFLESSTGSDLLSGDTTIERPSAAPQLAATRLGDFRLLKELGRGGMGCVYEAMHVKHQTRVALKTLPKVEGGALHRFKREFRSATEINHPNLIGLHTLQEDGGQWFFTMDLIEGVNFLNYVRPQGALDESRLRAALPQLAAGVMALHGHGIIHRDLKPSNVMVNCEGKVIILDFGLVMELESNEYSKNSALIVGTANYMAPEQAAAKAVTTSVDWYSVGVMIYQALTGKLPFSGPLLKVLQAKQFLDPPPLPEEGLPQDLVELCQRFLNRDPLKRPNPLEIAKVLSSQAAMLSPTSSTSGHILVGRESQLKALRDANQSLLETSQMLTVFVSGRSGEGKTSLVEHYLESLREQETVTVMSGRCYDRESVPFKALDSLIDTLASFLMTQSGEELALLIPRDIAMLARVFPVLQRVEVIAKAPQVLDQLDEQRLRRRAFVALRELFSRMSDCRPVILFIDDLQWGDSDSAEALFEVLRPPESPLIFFVGTFRSDEAASSPFLNKWHELQRKHDVPFPHQNVTVGPLTLDICIELVISLLQQDTDLIRQRAQEFFEETKGNPLLLVELVGCFDPETASFQLLPMHEVIDQKLRRLPGNARQLLDVVAISGQALSLEEASRSLGQSSLPILILTQMRNEHLVRLIGSEADPLVDTYHDRIRETVVDHMETGFRQTLHRTLAEVIEQAEDINFPELQYEVVGNLEHPQQVANPKVTRTQSEQTFPTHAIHTKRIYDLSYHFDAAGDQQKAFCYSVLAAEQAKRQFALEAARQQYEIAERNAKDIPKPLRYRIKSGYGETLMQLAEYETANKWFGEAIDCAGNVQELLTMKASQADILNKARSLDQSISANEELLRELGVRVPGHFFCLIREILYQRFVQVCQTLKTKLFGGSQKSLDWKSSLVIKVFNQLNHSLYFCNPIRNIWVILAAFNRCRTGSLSPVHAVVYAKRGMLSTMIAGWPVGSGLKYSAYARDIATEFDDKALQADASFFYGWQLESVGRFNEALTSFSHAFVLYSEINDAWRLTFTRYCLARVQARMGKVEEALQNAEQTFAKSIEYGQDRLAQNTLHAWTIATRGNLPFEELRSCFRLVSDDLASVVQLLVSESIWHRFNGRTDKALELAEQAVQLVRKHWLIVDTTIVAIPNLAHALRDHADAIASTDPKKSFQLRRRGYKIARLAVIATSLIRHANPYALRELSYACDSLGKTKKAHRLAAKSCRVAEQQQAEFEFAESLLACGQLSLKLKIPGAEEQIAEAEALLSEFSR